MTSRQVEDCHAASIQRLLDQAGVVCDRPAPASSESEAGEEAATPEETAEEALPEPSAEEEVRPEEEDKAEEEKQKIFPSASLRKILPDEIRNFEKINRIHVLPEEFNTTVDPAGIPNIAKTAPKEYIDVLAELVGCSEYRSSMAEFWFLDTLAGLLRRCQADGFDRETQATLVLWWCEFMKELEMFDAADRARFLRRFKENMLAAAVFISEEQRLPTPIEAGVAYRVPPSELRAPPASLSTTSVDAKTKPQVTFDSEAYQCSLRSLTSIIHYFYDLFSTDYQYDLVRSVFTHTPEYATTHAPHRLHQPKEPYVTAKPGKGKDTKKGAKEKGEDKKKNVPLTPEFVALMQLKQREEAEVLSLEQKEREEWERKCHILPLSMAVDEEFFNKYWPQPLPAVEEVVETKPKKK